MRFGVPFAWIGAARATSAASADRTSLLQCLNLSEGSVRRLTDEPVLTTAGLALLFGAVTLIVLGLVQRGDRNHRLVAAVGLRAGRVMLLPQLLLNAGINLHYIPPGVLLWTLPVAAGVVTAVATVVHDRSFVAASCLVGVGGVFCGWQLHLAAANAEAIAPLQARPIPLGEAVADAADGEACAFLSNVQWPETRWPSDCLGDLLDPDRPERQCHTSQRDLGVLAEKGYEVLVLARGGPPFSPSVSRWPVTELEEPEGQVRLLYQRPDRLGVDAPPSVPEADDPDAPPCLPSRAPTPPMPGWSCAGIGEVDQPHMGGVDRRVAPVDGHRLGRAVADRAGCSPAMRISAPTIARSRPSSRPQMATDPEEDSDRCPRCSTTA